MGLDTSAVMFLCGARSMGVDFGSTAMIGRQALWPDQTALARVFAVLGVDRDAGEFLRRHPFGEELLSLLGATRIESVDVCSSLSFGVKSTLWAPARKRAALTF